MMENENEPRDEFDVEQVMKQLDQIINRFNSTFGLDYSNNINRENFQWPNENYSNDLLQPNVPNSSEELFSYQNPTCYVCNDYYGLSYDEPTCDTCHAFLYPNVAPEEQFTIVNQCSDDDSDSGNDEPADNLFQPDACNTSNDDDEHKFPLVKVEADDLTENSNNISFGEQRIHVNLEDLPPEVLSQTLKYLDDISLWCFSQVKPCFEDIVLMHFRSNLWRRFVHVRWPLLHFRKKKRDWYKLYSSLMRSVFCLKCVRQMAAKQSPAGEESSWRNNRLKSELRSLRLDPLDGINAMPLDTMCCHWLASIQGPNGSPYEGGLFFLYIQIPYSYPMNPPTVRFLTKILHPNISRHGDVGIDSIHHNWSLALTLSKILLSIQSLLTDPFCDICMEPEIAEMYKKDRLGFEKQVRKWTWKYAMHDLLPF